MTLWTIAGLLAITCLVLSFFFRRNKIWDGLIIGTVIATVAAILMQHDVINSSTSKKIVVTCVLLATCFELINRLIIWNSPENRLKRATKRSKRL